MVTHTGKKPLYSLFGGTFDPIHNGHLNTVLSVVQSCELEQVCFIPAGVPVHRTPPHATAEQRYHMVDLAVKAFPRLCVEDIELKRESASFTYDTVCALKKEHPERQYCFIIGIDALVNLENWYRWKDLLECMHFIVMARPGWRRPKPLPFWWQEALTPYIEVLRNTMAGHILEVMIEPCLISATQIRQSIASGNDASQWVPAPVWDYICKHNLYLE